MMKVSGASLATNVEGVPVLPLFSLTPQDLGNKLTIEVLTGGKSSGE